MIKSASTLSQVRKIDNSRQLLPFITSLLLIFLIILFIWFLRGGSFKLYASLFFFLYSLTHQIWVSVISIGILQNIAFIPLRMISNAFRRPLKNFEDELNKTDEKSQYFVFTQKVKEGNTAIVFYIFNFFINAIFFFSAARIFLIDFYNKPLDSKLLHSWAPYPDYPLLGTEFKLPLLKITSTFAISWSTIFLILGSIVCFFVALRLLWRLFRFFLKKNKQILNMRIQYNRLILKISGFVGFGIIITVYFLRHIPNAFETFIFVADLTRPCPPMNLFTAVVTFITTIHAGFKNNSQDAKVAKKSGIDPLIVKKVFQEKMRNSFKNGLILGAGAFFITNQIPSAFELSVATFEVMYMIYPHTLGKIVAISDNHVEKLEISNES